MLDLQLRKSNLNIPSKMRICQVCGDKADFVNYGPLTCSSCKVFLRWHTFQAKVRVLIIILMLMSFLFSSYYRFICAKIVRLTYKSEDSVRLVVCWNVYWRVMQSDLKQKRRHSWKKSDRSCNWVSHETTYLSPAVLCKIIHSTSSS